MDLVTLADLPELAGTDTNPRSRITVARLGKYSDPRYGRFEIGEADFEGWQRNLTSTFGGKVSVDFDHSSDRGRGTEAAAWITGLERQGKDVIADVEWTPKGAAAIRDKSYQFISPTYTEHYKDEHGVDRGRALLGAACTNRPVLRQLPTLSLSQETVDGAATVPPKGAAKRERKRARELALSRDSRAQMADKLSDLRKLLDLEDDADQATILAAAAALKPDTGDEPAKAPEQAEPAAVKTGDEKMTLDADGHVLLSQDAYAELLKGSNAGQAAALALAEEKFDRAWTKAVEEGRAAPAMQDNLRELHRENPELATKTLDSFVRIVPTTPTGSGAGAGQSGPAPAGMDEDRFQLHQEATQLAAKKVSDNPKLDPGEAYALAAVEIEDRKFTLENPGI